jgi:hypothetical protein
VSGPGGADFFLDDDGTVYISYRESLSLIVPYKLKLNGAISFLSQSTSTAAHSTRCVLTLVDALLCLNVYSRLDSSARHQPR